MVRTSRLCVRRTNPASSARPRMNCKGKTSISLEVSFGGRGDRWSGARWAGRDLPCYQAATPDRLYRHFVDAPGRVTINAKDVVVSLGVKTYTLVLLGPATVSSTWRFPDGKGARLRFNFPPS